MGVGAQVLFRLNILFKQNDMSLMISLRNHLPVYHSWNFSNRPCRILRFIHKHNHTKLNWFITLRYDYDLKDQILLKLKELQYIIVKFSLCNTNSQECYHPVFSVHQVFYGQFASDTREKDCRFLIGKTYIRYVQWK